MLEQDFDLGTLQRGLDHDRLEVELVYPLGRFGGGPGRVHPGIAWRESIAACRNLDP